MAEKSFRRAIKLNPNSKRAHKGLILFLSEHGNKNQLIEAIKNGLGALSNDIPMLSMIGDTLMRLDYDLRGVEKLYLHIISLEAKHFVSHVQLAIIYQRLDMPELAIEYITKVQSMQPTFRINDHIHRKTLFAKPSENRQEN